MKCVFFLLWALSLNPLVAGVVSLGKPQEETEVINHDSLIPNEEYKDVLSGGDHPLGARPDCSETPVSADQLEAVAANPEINSAMDFINALPSGSFQTFTLVTNSKSAQRCEGEGEVSAEWPRVLRTSVDGKITFSYTCNPASCAYNQIEVIYHDDEVRQLKTMSFDFRGQPVGGGDHKRVHHNDQSCLNCHGSDPSDPSSFRHIWPEYFQWSGCEEEDTISLYGGNDDVMNAGEFRAGAQSPEYKKCSSEQIKASHQKQVSDYANFKERHLGEGENFNPCYGSLPWAQASGEEGSHFDPKKYTQYPFASERADVERAASADNFENMYLRTNLRMTQNYARLNAIRIAGLVEKSPDFEDMKLLLAMDAAECLNEDDEDIINNLVPNLNYRYRKPNSRSFESPAESTPLLYQYGKFIGLNDQDWSLEYGDHKGRSNVSYSAVIPRVSYADEGGPVDTGMPEVAAAEILKTVAGTNPVVAAEMDQAITRGASRSYGPQWACMDDLGGAVENQHRGPKRPLCVALRSELEEFLKDRKNITCPRPEVFLPEDETSNLEVQVRVVEGALEKSQIDEGRNIAKKNCFTCHSTEGDMNFMAPSSMHFFSNSGANEGDRNKIQRRATAFEEALRSGRMPASGKRLTDDEIDSLLIYIESLNR